MAEEKIEEFNVPLTHVDINNIMVAFNAVVKSSPDEVMDKNINARALLQNKFIKAMEPKE